MDNIKKLQTISFIGGMFFYTPIFTLFLLQQHISLGFIVAAQTVFSVGMMLSTVPTGILGDKWGQKRVIQIGLLLDALTILMLLVLHSPLALIIFFALRGVGVGFRDGADEALLYDSYLAEYKSTEGYSKSFGKMTSNDVLGFVIATGLAGIAVQLFGAASYVPLIIVTSFASLGALAVATSLETPGHIARLVSPENMITQFKAGIKVVKKSHALIALTLMGLLTLNGEYFLRQTYQPFFQDLAVPAIFLGLSLSAGKLLNFMVIRNSHHLEKYLTVDQILLTINAALGASFVLLAFSHSVWMVLVAFMLIQALLNSDQPIVSDYVNQQINPGQRSTVLSTISLIKNSGQILARIGLGISIGLVGLGYTYVAQGAYLLFGAVIGVWYLRKCGCVHKVAHTADAISEEAVVV